MQSTISLILGTHIERGGGDPDVLSPAGVGASFVHPHPMPYTETLRTGIVTAVCAVVNNAALVREAVKSDAATVYANLKVRVRVRVRVRARVRVRG